MGTNNDAWARTLTLLIGGLFGGGGIVTLIVKALIKSWEVSQKAARESQNELIGYLKSQLDRQSDKDEAKIQAIAAMTNEIKLLTKQQELLCQQLASKQ